MPTPLEYHKNGKLQTALKVKLKTKEDLSLAYTPGVAEPCKEIARNKELAYQYTNKGNSIAIISDGSSVLGLGNIGPEASMPVMEGKAIIFKKFADIDAWPIVLGTQDPQKIIETIKNIAPGFGAINLEDIKAPECFEIESALQDLGIPVMHDDQHGTAVVVLAGLINAQKALSDKRKNIKIVINGAGAAGTAVAYLLLEYGYTNIIVCDSKGAIRTPQENTYKQALASKTNKDQQTGTIHDVLKGADVFIGVSKGNLLSPNDIKSMNKNPIIFALANPVPEILPDIARASGAAIVATGRSDFANQVNNALTYPGIFRGALNARATKITTKMKLAAALALANTIKRPTQDKILPQLLDKKVVPAVAKAVEDAWKNQNEK